MRLYDTVFPKRGRRALVLCDGPRPGSDLIERWLRGADCFVCTDAAGRPYDRLPRRPDLVIGDFDTLGEPAPSEKAIAFHRVSEQESSDSEKALRWLAGEGYEETVLLGATGERLDHSLFNVILLERFAGRLRLCLADELGLGLRLGPGGENRWDLPAGTPFSLLPLAGPAEGVSLEGATYPLHDATVGYHDLNTLSNKVAAPPLRVRLRGGSLFLWVGAPFPGESSRP